MPANLVIRPGARGLRGAEFADLNGTRCRVGESSLATEDGLWLGPRTTGEDRLPSMMLIDRSTAAALVPLLDSFARTGRLPAPPKGSR